MKTSSFVSFGLLTALLPLHASLAQTPVSSATLSFSASSAPVGTWPKSTAVADFDKDGQADLAVGHRDTKDIRFLRGLGDGRFGAFGAQAPLAVGGNVYYLQAGDLDGDGWSDLVAADPAGKRVLVYRNQGAAFSGTPSASLSVDLAGSANASIDNVVAIALADLDKDGKRDIVATHREDDSVHVFFNRTASAGSLSFAAATPLVLPTYSTPWAIVPADINRDGSMDIALALTNGATLNALVNGSVRILFNCTSSSSRLCLSAGSTPMRFWPYDISTRDMNRDAAADLVVVNAESDSATVLRNTTPAGATQESFSVTHYTVGNMPKALTIADLNGDCLPDVAVSNHFGGPVLSLLMNNPAAPGSFTQESIGTIPDLLRGISLSTIDSNRDNILDLVLAGASSNNVVSLLNTTGRRCY